MHLALFIVVALLSEPCSATIFTQPRDGHPCGYFEDQPNRYENGRRVETAAEKAWKRCDEEQRAKDLRDIYDYKHLLPRPEPSLEDRLRSIIREELEHLPR
jgi:hypothetical protein